MHIPLTIGTYTISGAYKTVITYPSLTEQTAIAEITVLEAKLAKASQIKQGMMQELLTGRMSLV